MKILRHFLAEFRGFCGKFLCVSFMGVKAIGFILKRMNVDCKVSVPA